MNRSFLRGVNAIALVLIATVFFSCSATADLAIQTNHSATLGLSFEIPPAVEAKLRSFSSSAGSPASTPLFDPASVAAGAREKGLIVMESLSPRVSAYRGKFYVDDLDSFVSGSGLDSGGLFTLTRGQGWTSLRVNATRQNAAILVELFPGIDKDLLEALQPPALYDNPVTKTEYRSMLSALLGKSALEALDAAFFSLSISLPGPILESEGFAISPTAGSGFTARFTLPAIDALTLELPVAFHVKWKE